MTKNNQLATILEEQEVSSDSQKALIAAFGAPFTEAGEILANYQDIKVTSVDQIEDMQEAREKRLALRRVRIDVENKRKELKEDSLKTGRAIDAAARFVKTTIEPAEKYLETQERFKALKEEAERAERYAARVSAISKFDDPDTYKLETMEESAFQQLLIKLEKEAADQAEADRIEYERVAAEVKAESERQTAIYEENQKLLAEKAEREKAEKIEAEKRAKAEAAERAAHEAELQKERDLAEAERKKREAIEKIEAERKAAESIAAAEAAEAERQSLLAPDKDKIRVVMAEIEVLRANLPATKAKRAQALVNEIDSMLGRASDFIEKQVESL